MSVRSVESVRSVGVVSMMVVGSGGSAFAHAVPGDVDTAIFSNSELSAPNGAHSHGRVRLSVDLDGFGKILVTRFTADVKNIAGSWLAFEIDEVDNAFGV